MALTYKKLSELTDMTSANIDTTTKLVVTTGSTKVNNNLKVTDLIVDDLVTNNQYRALSAKQGKKLEDEKAPILNPAFQGTVSGINKAMVGLGNVDNTSDANKPVSTAQANTLAPKASPIFTGEATIPGQKALVVGVVQGDTTPGSAVYINNDGDAIFTIDRISGDIGLNPDMGGTYLYSTPEHADNAAAATAGLVNGRLYRTGDVLKVVHP